MGDPIEDDLVVIRADVEPLPPAVRKLLSGLGEHEAAGRVGAVEPPPGEIIEQRFIIKLRIVPSQRELEAVLAFCSAVTSPGRAADLVQDRRHIAQEGNLGRFRGARRYGRYQQ